MSLRLWEANTYLAARGAIAPSPMSSFRFSSGFNKLQFGINVVISVNTESLGEEYLSQ